jgi:hypothetical protein
MSSDGKKIHLLEKLIQTHDDELLSRVEKILDEGENATTRKSAFSLQGLLSVEDANELNTIIEKGCKNIDEDRWN